MLPFTKRPGRGAADDNGPAADGHGDVVTKDSLSARPKTAPPPQATQASAQPGKKAKTVPPPSGNKGARSIPPPGAGDRPRLFQPSISDEEMTTLMPSKSAERERARGTGKSPPPAAGRPASNPPAAGAPASMRGKALSIDDEGDEGRTQIRAPLAGRMLVPNSQILSTESDDEDERTVGVVMSAHPADAPEPTRAMLGAPSTQSGAVAVVGGRPAAGRPNEPSVEIAQFNSVPAPAQSHPLMLQQQHGGMQHPPTAMMRPQQQPMAFAPTMMQVPNGQQQPHQQPMVAHLSGAYPQQHGMPAPAMSQPAHFAVPQMAPSEARMDPPATVFTQSSGSRGSRTMSWAAALMAVGIFVGLVAAVVAGGGSDTLADTSASFVDPSRPGKRAAAAAQPDPNAAPTAQPVMAPMIQPQAFTQPPVAGNVTPPSVFPNVNGGTTAPPSGLNPPDPTAVGAPLANNGTGVNTGSAPQAAGQTGQTAPATPAAPPVAVAVAPTPAPQPAPQPVAAAPQRPVAVADPPKPKPAPVAQPAPQAARPEPVAAAPKPPKPAPAAKPAKGGGDDDELKKAADALSKAQLENSL